MCWCTGTSLQFWKSNICILDFITVDDRVFFPAIQSCCNVSTELVCNCRRHQSQRRLHLCQTRMCHTIWARRTSSVPQTSTSSWCWARAALERWEVLKSYSLWAWCETVVSIQLTVCGRQEPAFQSNILHLQGHPNYTVPHSSVILYCSWLTQFFQFQLCIIAEASPIFLK